MEASSNSAALAQVGARGPRHRTAQLPLLSSSMPSHLTGGHTSPALVDRKFQGLGVRTEALSLGRSERAGQNRGYLLSRWRAAVGGRVAPPAGGHLGPSHE